VYGCRDFTVNPATISWRKGSTEISWLIFSWWEFYISGGPKKTSPTSGRHNFVTHKHRLMKIQDMIKTPFCSKCTKWGEFWLIRFVTMTSRVNQPENGKNEVRLLWGNCHYWPGNRSKTNSFKQNFMKLGRHALYNVPCSPICSQCIWMYFSYSWIKSKIPPSPKFQRRYLSYQRVALNFFIVMEHFFSVIWCFMTQISVIRRNQV